MLVEGLNGFGYAFPSAISLGTADPAPVADTLSTNDRSLFDQVLTSVASISSSSPVLGINTLKCGTSPAWPYPNVLSVLSYPINGTSV